MKRFMIACTLACLAIASFTSDAQECTKVTMPLERWERMLLEIESDIEPDPPAFPVARIERRIEGSFTKGLFSGTLTEVFEVIDTHGHVRVPLLDGEVSLGEVLLDGKRTSLLREGSMYTLGIDEPGEHRVRLEFYAGEDQDRFARRLKFSLPRGGITHVSVLLPETDIEPRLTNGALTRVEPGEKSTLLVGNLDSSGQFDLSWTRRVTHKGDQAVVMEAVTSTLFTVGESVIAGKTSLDLSVVEGETDLVELQLREGIEIIDVEGDAVLQWRTDAEDGGRLTILLRYLVSDRIGMMIRFQTPADATGPISLLMPWPAQGTPTNGTAGVLGPSGLKIDVVSTKSTTCLSALDMPAELTDLTANPLMFGFSFTEPPTIEISVSRHEQVTLTSTLVEEIQASTVLSQDGTEVTKLKIRIRNNTREYLTVHLPEGTVLTHSLIDGQPIRPAVAMVDGVEVLLVPLRQSERLKQGETRLHTVRQGETLSDISNFYYSDPSHWQMILSSNPETLYSADSVTAGQSLRIPTQQGVAVEESAFIIELAYKAGNAPLGNMGRASVELPSLDVDTMRATWHLYFPGALDPINFDANLTQYSAIRYDIFRRAREFLDRTLWIQYAWAGGKYESILKQRKAIYRNERDGRGTGKSIRAAFPLVGEQYRFKRILLGKETPKISITYVNRTATFAVKWLALVGAFALTLLLLSRIRDIKTWIAVALGLVLLLIVAHYILGVHRRVVWGIDMGLIFMLARSRTGRIQTRLKELLHSPWSITEFISIRNLLFAVGLFAVICFVLAFPLLVSCTAMVVLILLWQRTVFAPAKEARDA